MWSSNAYANTLDELGEKLSQATVVSAENIAELKIASSNEFVKVASKTAEKCEALKVATLRSGDEMTDLAVTDFKKMAIGTIKF